MIANFSPLFSSTLVCFIHTQVNRVYLVNGQNLKCIFFFMSQTVIIVSGSNVKSINAVMNSKLSSK